MGAIVPIHPMISSSGHGVPALLTVLAFGESGFLEGQLLAGWIPETEGNSECLPISRLSLLAHRPPNLTAGRQPVIPDLTPDVIARFP